MCRLLVWFILSRLLISPALIVAAIVVDCGGHVGPRLGQTGGHYHCLFARCSHCCCVAEIPRRTRPPTGATTREATWNSNRSKLSHSKKTGFGHEGNLNFCIY